MMVVMVVAMEHYCNDIVPSSTPVPPSPSSSSSSPHFGVILTKNFTWLRTLSLFVWRLTCLPSIQFYTHTSTDKYICIYLPSIYFPLEMVIEIFLCEEQRNCNSNNNNNLTLNINTYKKIQATI